MDCNHCDVAGPPLSLPIVSRRFVAPIKFWCWKAARLSSAALTKSCSPPVDATGNSTIGNTSLSEINSSIPARISRPSYPRPLNPLLSRRQCRRISSHSQITQISQNRSKGTDMNPQNFANHTRWHPAFHFFILPVMLINFVWAIIQFVKTPNLNAGWWIVVSLALVLLALFVRQYPLKVQDRIMRLEERLRYQQALSPVLINQASALTPGQIVALRFAGDDELEELVGSVLAGKLTK